MKTLLKRLARRFSGLRFVFFISALALWCAPASAVMLICPDGTEVGPIIPPNPCEGHEGNPGGQTPPPRTPPPDANHSCGGAWSYEINPESTDQFECKENGHIVSGWKSCNEDGSCENHDLIAANCRARCERGEFGNPDPGKGPSPEPVGAQLLVDLSFSNLRSCTAKVDVIKSATDSIAASGATDKIVSAEAFCHTLYPLGAGQTLPLTAALSANYTFTDADDCVTKTSATEAEATSVKRETSAGALEDVGDPQSYCTGLFPSSPPSNPPPSNPPPPPHSGTCGAWMENVFIGTACARPDPEIKTSVQESEDACARFCSQFGPGYCDYFPGNGSGKQCSWVPAKPGVCGPANRSGINGISSSLCGGAPLPPPFDPQNPPPAPHGNEPNCPPGTRPGGAGPAGDPICIKDGSGPVA